jgi:glycine betaine catabolism B
MSARNLELKFIKKVRESKDSYSFYFTRPKDFKFNPGQYVKIFLDIKNPDKRGSSRYFTISSSPTEKDFIVITTKIIKSSFKKEFLNLIPNEKINAFGPVGYFDFNQDKDKNIVLLSGGIGITPYHSLIKFIDTKKLITNVTLIASFDFHKNIIFYEELMKIENENKLIKIIYTLTKEKREGFEKGRVNEDLLKKYIKDLKTEKFYLVGSDTFTEEIYTLLTDLEVKEENIFKEDFSGY